jgi:uncharacterized protein
LKSFFLFFGKGKRGQWVMFVSGLFFLFGFPLKGVLVKMATKMEKHNFGREPLWGAVSFNNVDYATRLLKGGAKVNHLDDHGETVLHNAAIKGHADCVILLLEYKADPLIQTPLFGRTALHFAASHDAKCLRLLCKSVSASDIDKVDSIGRTPLDCALLGNKEECVNILLEYGAKI